MASESAETFTGLAEMWVADAARIVEDAMAGSANPDATGAYLGQVGALAEVTARLGGRGGGRNP